jgi:predicted MFS family arabinose efflux permease
MSEGFPWVAMLALSGTMFASALVLTAAFPVVGPMTASLLEIPVEHAGSYAGMLAAGFMLGRVLSSTFWGSLSDLIGRKPVIIIGTVGGLATNLLFGMSWTFEMAMAFRCLGGLLNGVVGVSKAVAGEIVSQEYQGASMMFLTAAWSLGMVFGPAIGGLLQGPETLGAFSAAFPFALPMVVVTVMGSIILVFAIAALPETLPETERRPLWQGFLEMLPTACSCSRAGDRKAAAGADPFGDSGRTGSVVSGQSVGHPEARAGDDRGLELAPLVPAAAETPPKDGSPTEEASKVAAAPVSAAPESLATPGPDPDSDADSDSDSASDVVFLVDGDSDVASNPDPSSQAGATAAVLGGRHEDPKTDKAAACGLLCRPAVRTIISAYAAFSCAAILVDEVFPIWALTQPQFGGLGLTAADVGLVLATSGAAMVTVQLTVCPVLMRQLPAMRLFLISAMIQIPLVLCYPLIHLAAIAPGAHSRPATDAGFEAAGGNATGTSANVPGVSVAADRTLVLALCWVLVFVRLCNSIVGFASCAVLVNASVSNSERGTVNGLAMSLGSVGKAIGPASGGALLALGLTAFGSAWLPYIASAVVHAAVVVIIMLLPDTLNKPQAQRDLEEAEASLEQAEASLGAAEAGLEEPEAGLEEPEAGLEEAKAGLEEAKTGPEEAKTGLEEAKTGLEEAKTGLGAAERDPNAK